ncbi:L-asparaginase/GlutRNAGln amidotransferase subunit D [Leptothrix ochracea L12]|uniref:L-asparaginase/GlutRNAGln amidotransferase subunit D n=1 Tax=Leptothrix ochracea L12 TaxID=735332 RepID=I4Z509_9BURK|nr:asparaginase [Leptothrix ochracea]EIM31301.1 L-asparaginase/GlutRNAGln amidotransferase subunit D [Leptothrix ochracea L12]
MTSSSMNSDTIVVLGTGGTIAGRADRATDQVGYVAAQLAVADLLTGLGPVSPAGEPWCVEAEQVAQLDSKDMSHAVWQDLATRVAQHVARPDVQGVVITHGTDTLEETAYFLHRVLAPTKPVVLTAAMRPATSLQADGPQNLADALSVVATAAQTGAQGVLVVMAGYIHSAWDIRKLHTHRLEAFSSGDAGPLGVMAQGSLRRFRPWDTLDPKAQAVSMPYGLDLVQTPVNTWPKVAILLSHAGHDESLLRAQLQGWIDAGVRGVILAGTGNATLHHGITAALEHVDPDRTQLARMICSRCALGPILRADPDPAAQHLDLSPVQARIELMLRLMRASKVA